MKSAVSWLIKCTGLVIFVLLVRRIGITAIVAAVSHVGILPFLSAVSVLVTMSLVKALRWRVICKGYGMDLSYPFVARSYLVGTFLGFLTPGRIGEMFRAYHVKARGYGMTQSVSSVVLDRLCDLCLLGLLSGSALLYLYFRYGIFNIPDDSLFLRMSGGIGVITGLTLAGWRIIHKSAKFRKLVAGIRAFRPGIYNFGVTILLTGSASLLGYLQLFWIAYSLGINLDFLTLTSCALVMSLIQLLPVSILGIGTRDITLIYLFSHFGIVPQKAIALSLVNLTAHILAITPGMLLFLADKSSKVGDVVRTIRKETDVV